MARPEVNTTPLRLAAYWIVVLVPLGWGVMQSVVKSLPLLQGPAAPAVSPASGR